jgi:RecB family endonuclease NucS
LRATINGDCDAVAAGIDAVHMANTSILNYNDENALACVITLAYYNAINEYTLHREMPAGKGYADILFRPRKYSDCPAMVVELKMNQSAESALAQIKERRYVEALTDYEGKVLLVGVNYDRETKEHTCVIEEFERN